MSSAGLQVSGLFASFGTSTILRGVDLTVPCGNFYVLLGANGAGKSTLLDCIVGRRALDSGRIMIDLIDHAEDPRGARMRLGYACPPEELPKLLTVRECFEIHVAAKRLAGLDASVSALGEELELDVRSDAWVDTLSLGTRQKLSVLLALVGDPRLIVLDETFNGLDARSALILKNALHGRAKAGASVLLATHDLSLIPRYADSVGLLHDGRIAKEWDRPTLKRLSADGFDALENALAAVVSNTKPPEG